MISPQSAGYIHFVPGDQLADQFGKAEREDNEIDACQALGCDLDGQRQDQVDGDGGEQHKRMGAGIPENCMLRKKMVSPTGFEPVTH